MKFHNRIADCDRLKQEIDQHRPLKGPALKQLHEYFRIGLTWTSNALEGNSLTETETKVVIEDGITIGGKSQPFLNLLSNMVWEGQRDYLRLLQSMERK